MISRPANASQIRQSRVSLASARVDLATELLEVDVCAQHNNGGFAVDSWWRSNLEGFFPVGEAAGSHGVYRPGGSALNSGQVGATRAAEYIAKRRAQAPSEDSASFARAARGPVGEALDLVNAAAVNAAEGVELTSLDLLQQLAELMSADAGPVRSATSIDQARAGRGCSWRFVTACRTPSRRHGW